MEFLKIHNTGSKNLRVAQQLQGTWTISYAFVDADPEQDPQEVKDWIADPNWVSPVIIAVTNIKWVWVIAGNLHISDTTNPHVPTDIVHAPMPTSGVLIRVGCECRGDWYTCGTGENVDCQPTGSSNPCNGEKVE